VNDWHKKMIEMWVDILEYMNEEVVIMSLLTHIQDLYLWMIVWNLQSQCKDTGGDFQCNHLEER
jgi:hypothetical protein